MAVLNTDNVVITGESFDYGPWRWLPVFEPGFTAAYFDQTGLYAYGRQLDALGWNLARLAECLASFTEIPPLQAALDQFFPRAMAQATQATHRRLHLRAEDPAAPERNQLVLRRHAGDEGAVRTRVLRPHGRRRRRSDRRQPDPRPL